MITKTKITSFTTAVIFSVLFSPLVVVAKVPALTLRSCDCSRPVGYVPVCSEADLNQISLDMASNPNPLNYAQCNDITLSNGFKSIGLDSNGIFNASSVFLGTYDGQGFAIRNLTAGSLPNGYTVETQGLFATIGLGTVRNLNLLDINMTGSAPRGMGALAAEVDQATIENITAVGVVNKQGPMLLNSKIGFLVGSVRNSDLRNINVTGRLSSNQNSAGGIFGRLYHSTLSSAVISIDIDRESPFQSVGGLTLVADNSQIENIRLNVNFNAIDSNCDVGGLAVIGYGVSIDGANVTIRSNQPNASAYGMGGLITIVYNPTTNITRTRVNIEMAAKLAGGLISSVRGHSVISQTEVSGSMSGTGYIHSYLDGLVGGLIALIDLPTLVQISESAFKGHSLVGSQAAGGLIGYMAEDSIAEIHDSFVTAQNIEALNLDGKSGGLVGSRSLWGPVDLTIRQSYAFSPVLGNAPGGILGGGPIPDHPFVLESSIYSEDLVSVDNGFGTPATTAEMQFDMLTYAGYDFANVWRFHVGQTPRLRALDLMLVDFNSDGLINVSDIFAYLSAYFAGDMRADINNSDTLETADIFAFLSLWFANN